jgi:hypothetical protein
MIEYRLWLAGLGKVMHVRRTCISPVLQTKLVTLNLPMQQQLLYTVPADLYLTVHSRMTRNKGNRITMWLGNAGNSRPVCLMGDSNRNSLFVQYLQCSLCSTISSISIIQVH